MENITCPWEPSQFLFFSSNVPDLVHYSHVIAIVSALAVGFLMFLNNPKDSFARLFLLMVSMFSIWAFLDVMLWATNSPSTVMFSWSLQVLLESLIFALAFYLFYFFLNHKTPSLKLSSLLFILLLPIIALLPTSFNLSYLMLELCESKEGPIAEYYSYTANIIFIALIILIGAKKIPKITTKEEKVTALYFGVGLIAFLLSFTLGNALGSFTEDWRISQYGLIGMPIFVLLIGYSIVRFRAFNIKVAGTQLLVVTLWLMVGSLIFIVVSPLSRLMVGATFVFTLITGYFLIRSVKLEIKRKEEIEDIAHQLTQSNERLKELDKQKSEFISIASHQLRTPLTAIKGYVSLLLEGSYGDLKTDVTDVLNKVYSVNDRLVHLVEDLLNVSRIEAGRIQYNFQPTQLADILTELHDMFGMTAKNKGLEFNLNLPSPSLPKILADPNKIKEISSNLIDNAIKYTPTGSVTVTLSQEGPNARIVIADTGIGIKPEDKDHLFTKFVRSKETSRMVVGGAGLGLFVGKSFVMAHKGTIRAESEGQGKGSQFIIELPIVNSGLQVGTMDKQQEA